MLLFPLDPQFTVFLAQNPKLLYNFLTENKKTRGRGTTIMAAKNVKCAECTKIKEWSFSENVVAFCPVAQKYVKAEDGCKKGEKKK